MFLLFLELTAHENLLILLLYEKRSLDLIFGPLSNSPVLFLLSPGKMLLTLFLFQKWLGSPFPEDL